MSKLIKSEDTPILDVKRIIPKIVDEESFDGDDEPFSPFLGFIEKEEEKEKEEQISQEPQQEGLDPSQFVVLEAEAKARAREIVEEAKREADRLRKEARETLENASKKAEEIESRAYNDGFEQGKRDGEELGKRQFDAISRRLDALIKNLNKQGLDLFEKYEAQMVELCIKIAKKVVGHELATTPQLILEAIRSASRQVTEANILKIYLNPKDLEIVEDAVLKGVDLTGGSQVEFLPKESIERGGCVIETDFGLIDATLGTRWKAIEESLEEILSKKAE